MSFKLYGYIKSIGLSSLQLSENVRRDATFFILNLRLPRVSIQSQPEVAHVFDFTALRRKILLPGGLIELRPEVVREDFAELAPLLLHLPL